MKHYLVFLLLICSFVIAQDSGADRLFIRLVEAELNLRIDGELSENVIFLNRVSKDKNRFTYPAIISLELVKENYSSKIIKEDRFLGRDVIVLELKPNNLGPYWQFIIDKRTGSRLAYTQFSATGDILAEGSYSKINRIMKRTNPRVIRNLELEEDQKVFYRQILANLESPKGYTPVKIARSTIGRDKSPALRISFFDGINTLVLLLILNDSKLSRDTETMQSIELNNHFLIAIGPVGKETLVNWLESFKNTPLNNINKNEFKSFLRDL